MDQDTRAKLERIYIDECERLEARTGRTFDQWFEYIQRDGNGDSSRKHADAGMGELDSKIQ
jgi:hypothetical protein